MQVINYLYQEFVHVTTRGNVDQTRGAILINLNVRQKKKRKGQTHLRLLQYYINIDNWRETRREEKIHGEQGGWTGDFQVKDSQLE
jgi:GTP:adenosylcobinamide-phosphate guanylyltransferase